MLLEEGCCRAWVLWYKRFVRNSGFRQALLPIPVPRPCSAPSPQYKRSQLEGGMIWINNTEKYPTMHLFIMHLILKGRSDPGSPFSHGRTTVAAQCASG